MAVQCFANVSFSEKIQRTAKSIIGTAVLSFEASAILYTLSGKQFLVSKLIISSFSSSLICNIALGSIFYYVKNVCDSLTNDDLVRDNLYTYIDFLSPAATDGTKPTAKVAMAVLQTIFFTSLNPLLLMTICFISGYCLKKISTICSASTLKKLTKQLVKKENLFLQLTSTLKNSTHYLKALDELNLQKEILTGINTSEYRKFTQSQLGQLSFLLENYNNQRNFLLNLNIAKKDILTHKDQSVRWLFEAKKQQIENEENLKLVSDINIPRYRKYIRHEKKVKKIVLIHHVFKKINEYLKDKDQDRNVFDNGYFNLDPAFFIQVASWTVFEALPQNASFLFVKDSAVTFTALKKRYKKLSPAEQKILMHHLIINTPPDELYLKLIFSSLKSLAYSSFMQNQSFTLMVDRHLKGKDQKEFEKQEALNFLQATPA